MAGNVSITLAVGLFNAKRMTLEPAIDSFEIQAILNPAISPAMSMEIFVPRKIEISLSPPLIATYAETMNSLNELNIRKEKRKKEDDEYDKGKLKQKQPNDDDDEDQETGDKSNKVQIEIENGVVRNSKGEESTHLDNNEPFFIVNRTGSKVSVHHPITFKTFKAALSL